MEILPVLALLYGNCPLIFKRTSFFSKHYFLFPRLVYRCFITLFSTSTLDYSIRKFMIAMSFIWI